MNITRCSNNYGPYHFPEKLIPLTISRVLNEEKVPVYGDGKNIRDWSHVWDHCTAIDLVLHQGVSGEVYNVGGHNERTNLEVVKTIISTLGKSEDLIEFVTDQKLFVYLVIVLLIVLLLTGFLTAGRFLSLNQSPKQADVIIVLSGGQGRVEKAAELYKAGCAPAILLSNSKESASATGDMLHTALALGIPQEVILTENVARSNYNNAEFTLPIMKEHSYKSAIVVSSEFHMRRVKFLFDRIYKKSTIELSYVGFPSGYNAKRQWSDRKSRETTFNEYV